MHKKFIKYGSTVIGGLMAATMLAACGTQTTAPKQSVKNSTIVTPKNSENILKAKVTHTLIPGLTALAKGVNVNFDIIAIDQQTHLLYANDRSTKGIDVFNVATPKAKYLRTIKLGNLPNGLVIVKDQNKIFSALTDSTVAVIDINPTSPKFNTVVDKINTKGKTRADEMDYDPKEKKLYVANGDDGFITVVNAVNDKIIKKIDNLGALEQPRYNPADGMMYVTAYADNAIIKIDPIKDKVVKKFDLGVKIKPKGFDINPKTNQAIIGGDEQQTLAWDFNTGKVIKTFNQVGGGDSVLYDSTVNMFFFGSDQFKSGSVIGLWSGSPIKFIGNVPAALKSHNVAYDQTNKMVYTCDEKKGEIGLLSFPLPKQK
jgi:YVTN family beta-propeller protein